MPHVDDSRALAVTILSRCLQLPQEQCTSAHAQETPEWDSFAHLEIVVELEERFDCRLELPAIESIVDVASLASLIDALAARDAPS